MAIKLDEFDAAINEVFSDFVKASYETRQIALDAAADVMVEKLKSASPQSKGKFAKKWTKRKYRDIVAVHNPTTVNGGGKTGIPLVNILEYKQDSPHYGFVRRAEQSAENEIVNTIIKNLEVSDNG